MKTLNQEFDVDKFLLEKLIISHFPLEDHAKSNKISAFWKEE
jgi:anoctamin-10